MYNKKLKNDMNPVLRFRTELESINGHGKVSVNHLLFGKQEEFCIWVYSIWVIVAVQNSRQIFFGFSLLIDEYIKVSKKTVACNMAFRKEMRF